LQNVREPGGPGSQNVRESRGPGLQNVRESRGPVAPETRASRPPEPPRGRGWRLRNGDERRRKPRLRKLRLLLILVGLGALAFISTVFGMMMAVASDLPQIENITQFKKTANSYLYDVHGTPIGVFAAPDHSVIDNWTQISPGMIHAVVAVEDRRFWTDPGIDIRGIARAFISDVTGGATQGASTIAEQFVKNVLGQENNRTVFEKLREAALAFQLTRRWKRTKIITQYLNTIYFGNGAYGVESAARVYFGKAHGYDANAGPNQPIGACGDATVQDPTRPTCASQLRPWESALLAGMIANPSAFDPFVHPRAAMDRRNLVLLDMYQQGYLTRADWENAKNQPLPTSADLQQPSEPPAAPYFTSWLRPQIISAVERAYHIPPKIAEYRAFYGGLKITTTLDLQMQQAAQQAIDAEFPPGSNGPTAALVAIDNKTGEVRAMVSGGSGSWNASQFNLATQGHRQPGSAFKVFTLAEALRTGEYGPDSVIDSAPQNFIVPNSGGKEHFIVHNFGNTYSGPITLQEATDISDNSVYSQVGIHVGTLRIARLATQMGIRSYVSHNYAMILGGLKIGVSPLDMAHAYETLAMGGVKVYNPILGDTEAHRGNLQDQAGLGPTGIHSITCTTPACGQVGATITDRPTYQRVLPAAVAATEHSMLEGVVSPGGTAALAAIPGVVVAGKTGTTSNYGDAWFVGWTPQVTTAVWVGYPNRLVPMTTAYNGGPVEGGTYPAIIWNNFMTQALQILANEQAAAHQGQSGTTTSASGAGPSSNSTSTSSAQSNTGGGTGNNGPTNSANGGGNATSGANGGGGAGGAGGGAGGTGGGAGGTGGGTAGGGGTTGATGGGTGGGGGGSSGGGGASGGAGLGGGTSSGTNSGTSSGTGH
jgi:penicillin-binding protein 1A